MNPILSALLGIISMTIWAVLWASGGWLIAAHTFHLRRHEQAMIGLGLGLILQVWLSNLLAQFIPLPYAFWISALGTLALGIALAWPLTKEKITIGFPLSVSQWLILGLIVWVFTAIGRGLAIFDDYQNVPMVSLIATGDIPPHFALDPKLRFGYHYLLLLLSAQVMRLGMIYPWNALDISRALTIGLSLMLTYLWVWRMTRSRVAGFLGALFAAFSGGARWLLILLPPPLVQTISNHITLIGSAAQSAPNLSTALLLPWRITGDGPIPFPFAYGNGIYNPMIISHGGVGAIDNVIAMLLLLTYRKWQDWRGGIVLTILLAASALTSEYVFLVIIPSLIISLTLYWLVKHSVQLPKSILAWFGITAVATVIALFQGGVITEIARDLITSIFGTAERVSYHTYIFSLSWPPTIISGHLGTLILTDPSQLFAALLEVGPTILALPLVILWGIKMLRAQRWWEAALAAGIWTVIPVCFIKYSGTAGISANARLLSGLLTPCSLYAFPLLWVWGRKRSEQFKMGLMTLGFVSIFGGVMLFGIELIAAQKPVLPVFIRALDVQMEKAYWNQLEPDALIFDPLPGRAVTIFGRFTDAAIIWHIPKPEWEALVAAPNPHQLHAAGFDYVYFGIEYWEGLEPRYRELLQEPCVKLVEQYNGHRDEDDFRKDVRRLLDIKACQ